MTDACGHNFCHDCILKIIADHDEWNCPECRSVQNKRADELTRNRLAEAAVVAFNASQDQSKRSLLCPYHNLELILCKYEIQ